MPAPLAPLPWLLRMITSRHSAAAIVGDAFEELAERAAAGAAPRHPSLWLNAQIARAIAATLLAAAPRLLRSSGLVLRDAVRAVRAAPGHSLFVVLVLAAGVTLATVTFSVVDAVVLKPLPVEHPERLVNIPTRDAKFAQRITPDRFWRLRDEMRTIEALAARMTTTGDIVKVDGVAGEWPVIRTTTDIFPILRLSPAIGRLWTADDEADGDTAVAVLGYRLWREQFGGDASILGKTVAHGRRAYTVIGVLSAASDHPEFELPATPIWVPMDLPRSASSYPFGILARMRPGVTTAQVADEVQRLTGVHDWRPDVAPIIDAYVAPVRRWMLLALGAAALVVLVACANVANLMLTRSVARTHEMAIRASLGASRSQIALSVLTEGLLLSGAATAGALLLSMAGIRAAKTAVMATIPWVFRGATISLNGRVLLAAAACAVVTGVLFSLVPAWHTSRSSAATVLKDSEAPTATGRRRWRSAFLIAEISTVVVLVVVSWLFVASLIRVTSVDLGIDRTNLLAVSPRLAFRTSVDEVQRRIERVPGVSAVAVSTAASLPLIGRAFGGAWITTSLQAADGPPGTRSALEALQYRVTPNYFAVAGLHFRRGGGWDAAADAPVVVLDEQAARSLFGDGDPIGRQVRAKEPAGVFTVIGTVPHVYARGPEDPDLPSAYFPLRPNPNRMFASLFVRTTRPAGEMLPALSEALTPIGPQRKEAFVFAAEDAVRRLTATRRFNAGLMAVFGLAGMLIGAAGVYAVMASFVAQQVREIGIRLALGASPARIQGSVLALASRHLLAGLALGAPIAWWLSRGFASLFFQVTPTDPSVYLSVAALIGGVGCLAAWVPARRAARIDPIVSLRR